VGEKILITGLVLVVFLFVYQYDVFRGEPSVAGTEVMPTKIKGELLSATREKKVNGNDGILVQEIKNIQMNGGGLLEGSKSPSDVKKDEIEVLMHEFNKNISDVAMRKSIKNKIDRVLLEYNAVILPEAVRQVKGVN